MGNTCQMFLEREKSFLSPYAFLTANTRGRDYPYVPCENRTEFQRDRDRILHSFSFRCLMNKTQVFLAPRGDNYRTRLTHTLEVSQIARIIARALRLNEDLTEAIALGHDIGHTPFGHSGERVMRKYYSSDFAHYKQSLRVVEKLEKNGAGLNLTWEVRDGIVNHTGNSRASTLEGIIVKFADRIAYINHDIDDACKAGILSNEDIPAELRRVLGTKHSERINIMVTDVINNSTDKPDICMSKEIGEATTELRAFLFDTIYTNSDAQKEDDKAKALLGSLFEYYEENYEQLPSPYIENIGTDSVKRCVCDYLSAMTDRYAIDTYQRLFIPEVWKR